MHRLTQSALAALAALAASAGQVHATIVILRADGSHAPSSQATKTYNMHTGGWDIHLNSLYAPGGVTSYTIRADDGETIDNVWIDVECWTDSNGDCIPAGSPVFVRLYSDAPGGLRTIHNIEQTGTAETLLMHAEATHDIGSVTVLTIGTIIAGRDVIGPVTGTTLDNAYRGVEAVIAGRDVRGDILATRGRVEHVQAGRHIGSAFSPISIRSKYGILHVHAEQDLHGEVFAGYGSGPGYVARLHCTRQFGLIRTPRLGSAVVTGRMTIQEHFDGAVIIGGSLAEYVDYIQLPPMGLTGQIIINADNVPGAMWDAPIYLGPIDDPQTIVLNGPLYDMPSGELGGGSIGLAPFRLHDQSCTPPNNATITLAPGQTAPAIALQHYGPIIWHFGSPVTIERRQINTEAPFVAVPASNFQMYRSEVNPTRLILAPAAGQTGLEPGYEYRIRPTANLRCDIAGEPPVQWQQDYIFSVQLPQCVGDLNNDNTVDVGDLLLLLASWGPVGSQPAADLNGDGVVDVGDLLMLLGNWGPCPF